MKRPSDYNYRSIIEHYIRQNANVRGYKSQLASAAGCQLSYVTQVLKGVAKLNSDQAFGLANFWGMSEAEAEYFMDLVNLDRATSSKLKARLKEKIKRYEDEPVLDYPSINLESHSLELSEATAFFSDWRFSAILMELHHHSKAEPIAKSLGLPDDLVVDFLNDLVKMKLATKNGKDWTINSDGFILREGDVLKSLYHKTVREKALEDFRYNRDAGLHHTTVIGITEEDFHTFKNEVHELFINLVKRATVSKSERVVGICFDFFSFSKSNK